MNPDLRSDTLRQALFEYNLQTVAGTPKAESQERKWVNTVSAAFAPARFWPCCAGLVVGNPGNYPETGCGDIKGNLPEADFWLALPKVVLGP